MIPLLDSNDDHGNPAATMGCYPTGFLLRKIPRSQARERMSAGQVRVKREKQTSKRPDEVNREIRQTREWIQRTDALLFG